MNLLRSPRAATALSTLFAVSLLAGCASLLGDFSVGEGGGGEDGGGADGAPASDTGVAGGDTGVGPGMDSGSEDSGSADSAKSGDSGKTADSATADSATPDSGSADSAAADSATPDSGSVDSGVKDSGQDVGVDQAAPWTPTVLDQAGELAFWLEASSANLVISSGLVESWNDQSKNKNDATNSNTGPTVVSAAINGHDALNFATNGLTLAMADAASIQFGTDQVYITAVARVTTGTPYFFAKYTTGVSGAGTYYKSGLLYYATSGLSDAGTPILGPVVDVDSQSGDEVDWGAPCFEDGKFHIVAMRRTNSSTVELTVDDQPPASGSTGSFDLSQPAQSGYVGSISFGSVIRAQNFDIAEILAVHSTTGVVADTDVANLHAYLKKKYAL